MIDRKKYYIAACRFAIHQIIKTGSSYFTISDGGQVLSIPWNNVLYWLDEKNKRGITEVIEDGNE